MSMFNLSGLKTMKYVEAIKDLPEPDFDSIYIFLAGTIDNGNSVDWQKTVKEYAEKSPISDRLVLMNPRRADWNPNATVQDVEDQINWELDCLEKADAILMYIKGDSLAPITLLELGLHARGNKLHVVCEEDYWRYTNVRVTCERYNVCLGNDLKEAMDYLFQM